MKLSIEELAKHLASALGVDALVTDPDRLATHRIDGKQARIICLPQTTEQIAEVLRICAEAQAALIPWGGGTALAIGNPPRQVDVILMTSRLNRVIEHDHANLTVTAQCGITLDSLQSLLAPRKQLVPFDAPFPDHAT